MYLVWAMIPGCVGSYSMIKKKSSKNKVLLLFKEII